MDSQIDNSLLSATPVCNRYGSLREEIIQVCREKDACVDQFRRLTHAATEREFLQVLLDNFAWCMSKKVLNTELMERFSVEVLLDAGVYVRHKENITANKSCYLFRCEVNKFKCDKGEKINRVWAVDGGSINEVWSVDGGSINGVWSGNGGSINEVRAGNGGSINGVWSGNGGSINEVWAVDGGSINEVWSVDGGSINGVWSGNGGSINEVRAGNGDSINEVWAGNGGTLAITGTEPKKISVEGTGVIRDLTRSKIYIYKSKFQVVEYESE